MDTTRLLGRTVLAALVGLAPCVGEAQILDRITLTPYIGWYTPVSSLGAMGETGEAGGVLRKLEQRPELAMGANASYWLNRRVAIELGGMFVPSDVKSTVLESGANPAASGAVTRDAHVLFGSLKIMAHLMPQESPFNVRLGLGPAIVSRGGPAYRAPDGAFRGLTDIGAAISACTRIPITDRVRLRLRAEQYLYQTRVAFRSASNPAASYDFGAKFQNDFVLSTGLQMFLGR
jgi:hypothetical protein